MSPLFIPSYSPFLTNPHIPCNVSCSPSPLPSPIICGYIPTPNSTNCYTCEIDETIFLNCYVVGFSGKLGLGATESTITVDLVERITNPCSLTSPSPGICPPTVNCSPAPSCPPITCTYDDCKYNGAIGHLYTFSLGSFCFTGVLINHEYSESSEGYRFRVTLSDGRQILSKTQVIVKGYYDDLPSTIKPNLINIAYDISQSVGDDNCGDGTKCEDFAKANYDQSSIYLSTVLRNLNGEYCQAPVSGTCLKINIDEIIDKISTSTISRQTEFNQIKLDQNTYSVIDLIVMATENLGYDFYVEIIGNTMFFRTVNKSIQPTTNDLYNLLTNPLIKDICSSKNYGQELTFNPTKRMILGTNYTYLSVTDGEEFIPNPTPIPSYCVKDLGFCYKEVTVSSSPMPSDSGKWTYISSSPIPSAQCTADGGVHWYQLPPTIIPGSTYYERVKYSNIKGGPPNTYQTEAIDCDPIIINVDTNPILLAFQRKPYFVKDEKVYYKYNNNYYHWFINAIVLVANPKKSLIPPSPSPDPCFTCPSPSPQPSCSPLPETSGEMLMFFGYERDVRPSANPDDVVVYVAKGEDFIVEAHRRDGIFYQYGCQSLIDAGILDSNFNDGKPYFVLTELELLTTGSFQLWKTLGALRDDKCPFSSFSWLCQKNLNWTIEDDLRLATMFLVEVSESRSVPESAGGITPNIQNNASKSITANFLDREGKIDKLTMCFNWLKNIYDTYYGKQFLVKVSDYKPFEEGVSSTSPSLPPSSSTTQSRQGICVKLLGLNANTQNTIDSNFPLADNNTASGGNLPLVVNGNGDGQGLVVSDQCSSTGGFPTEQYLDNVSKTHLLDLSFEDDIGNNFLTSEGNIEPFIKFGKIATEVIDYQDVTMQTFWKFGESFIIDSSILSDENSYIVKTLTQPDVLNVFDHILYLKASLADQLFFLVDCTKDSTDPDINCNSVAPFEWPGFATKTHGGGAFALLTINTPITLVPTGVIGIKQGVEFFLMFRDEYKNGLINIASPASNKFGASPGLDILNLNVMNPISVMPAGAVVPLQSNTYSYGPYYFVKAPTGSVEFTTESDLHPSAFNAFKLNPKDSYRTMHLFGGLFARDGLNQLQKLETGTYTVHHLPSLTLGRSLGVDVPVLINDMSVNFGASGFNTTYNFQTYSPRFGTPARHILDQYKLQNKSNSISNSLRKNDNKNVYDLNRSFNQQLRQSFRKTSGNNSRSVDIPFRKRSTANTLVLSGYHLQVFPSSSPYGTNTVVNNIPDPLTETITYETLDILLHCPINSCSSLPLPVEPVSVDPSPVPSNNGNLYRISSFAESDNAYQKTYAQEKYGNLGVMSWDGIFLPVSLKGGKNEDGSYNNHIARFAYFSNPDSGRTSTVPKMPQFDYKAISQYSLPIQQKYLTPTTSRKMLVETWDNRKNNSNQGFIINTIAYGSNFDKFANHSHPRHDPDRQEADDFRFNALRGPLVIQAWGYDTTGKPIPNHADSPKDTEEGKFINHHLTDKFMKNWLINPRTWPVGPVDLRFDRERGVWVCPPSDRIVLAKLTSDLVRGGTATARLVNIKVNDTEFYSPNGLWDKDGKNIKLDILNTSITVYDYIGLHGIKNNLVYTYWDGDKYIVMNVGECYDECMYGYNNLREVTNYKCNKEQVLGHGTDGCLEWLDTTDCNECELCCGLDTINFTYESTQSGGGNQIAQYTLVSDPECDFTGDDSYPGTGSAYDLSITKDNSNNYTYSLTLYCDNISDYFPVFTPDDYDSNWNWTSGKPINTYVSGTLSTGCRATITFDGSGNATVVFTKN